MRRLLPFHRAEEATTASGVYAWYCRFDLSERDISDCIEYLATLPHDRVPAALTEFLHKQLFSKFAEAPYRVTVAGKLKPRYEGTVPHVPHVSKSLIERIVDDPGLLRELARVLRIAAPEFASPIYIGSAARLRTRLATHVRLMRKYRELMCELQEAPSDAASDAADHSFAHEAMVVRRLDPNDLWVSVLPTPLAFSAAVPLENVLNRINYPLCGRN